jgi:hypothetical protein
MFRYLSPETRVPKDHPVRPLRQMVNRALRELWRGFQAMYSRRGAPPARRRNYCGLCSCRYCAPSAASACSWSNWMTSSCFAGSRACRWMTRFGTSPSSPRIGSALSVRTWRGLFRTHPRPSGPDRTVVGRAFHRGLNPHRGLGFPEEFPAQEHRAPDGGSARNPEVDFHGERRLNQTPASTTDPEARRGRKGKGITEAWNWGMDIHPHRCGVQSGADTQPDGRDFALNRKEPLKGGDTPRNRQTPEKAAQIY